MAVGCAVLVAFLLGFIPEYLHADRLAKDLAGVRQEKQGLLDRQKLEQLRGEIDQTYIQASRKNFGVASGQASSFFDHVRTILNNSSDSDQKQKLQKIADGRDIVISGLAKADPAVMDPIGAIADEISKEVPATL